MKIKFLIILISIAFNLRGQSVKELYSKADNLALLGKYEEAIPFFELVLEKDKEYTKAYIRLAESFYNLGMYEKAIDQLTIVINKLGKTQLDFEIALIIRSGSYAMSGQYKLAIKDCNQILKMNDRNTYAYFIRGESYRMLGKVNKTIRDFDMVLLIDPEFGDYQFYQARGELYYFLNDEEEAEINFTKALSLEPSEQEIRYLRAKCRAILDKDSLAIEDLMQINPNRLDADDIVEYYYILGYTNYNVSNYNKAVDNLKISVGYDSTYSLTYRKLGRALFELSKYKEAISYFKKAISINEEDNYSKMYLSLSYINIEKYHEAKGILSTVDKKSSIIYFSYNCYGVLYTKTNQIEKALDNFQKSIDLMKLNRLDWEPYYNRAKLYFEIKNYRLGCNDIEKVKEIAPEKVNDFDLELCP